MVDKLIKAIKENKHLTVEEFFDSCGIPKYAQSDYVLGALLYQYGLKINELKKEEGKI
jgi:hypothetical protein